MEKWKIMFCYQLGKKASTLLKCQQGRWFARPPLQSHAGFRHSPPPPGFVNHLGSSIDQLENFMIFRRSRFLPNRRNISRCDTLKTKSFELCTKTSYLPTGKAYRAYFVWKCAKGTHAPRFAAIPQPAQKLA
jgi:hypothetical protein